MTTAATFAPAQLRYAATSRCPCGAGLAYAFEHRDGVRPTAWDCSAVLTGTAIPSGQPGAVEHTGVLPFAFYEIKSEDQPSANGMTTRPDEPDGQRRMHRQILANDRVKYIEGRIALRPPARAAEDAKDAEDLATARAEYEQAEAAPDAA